MAGGLEIFADYVSEIHYQSGRGAEVRSRISAPPFVGMGRGLPVRRRTVEGGRGPQMCVALRPFVRVRCALFRAGEAHRVVGHRRWSAPVVPLAALAFGRVPGACLCQSLIGGVSGSYRSPRRWAYGRTGARSWRGPCVRAWCNRPKSRRQRSRGRTAPGCSTRSLCGCSCLPW